MSAISPLTQAFPLVDGNGNYTPEFKRYLDQVLARIGGVQGGSYQGLTDGPAVTWDVDQKPTAFLVLGGNRTLSSPANMVAGHVTPYRLTVIQDATGGRTLSWGAAYKFPSGTPPALSAAANAVDEFWFSSDGTNMKLIASAKDLR